MRRAFFRVAGVLALSAAGLFVAFGMTASAQSPPPLPGASPKPSPVWNVQPGQVRVYVWVWWYDARGRRVAGKPVKVRNWRGVKLVGWQSAHSEHYRELRLRSDTRVCVKAFVKNAKTTPSCQVVTGAVGQKLVFVVRVGVPVSKPTGPRPPTPPTPPPPVAPATPTLGGVFATLNCVGGVQGGPFAVQATVNGIPQVAVAIVCGQRLQVAVAAKGAVVPVCFLSGGLPLLCKQAVAGVRGVVFTLTPPVAPVLADVFLHLVCASVGTQVGVVVYVNGAPRPVQTFACSTPGFVGSFPPGTVLQFCLQWPAGSVWFGGGPCITIRIDATGRVTLDLRVIFQIVVVITTTPPPGGTTTVVTTVTTPTTTSGVPANPNP